jgi:kynurenine formamidase
VSEEFRDVGKRLSNWGRWGADDSLGTLNLITRQRRADAARLVRTGLTIPLGLAFDRNGPQVTDGMRQNPVHLMTRLGNAASQPGGIAYLDDALFLHTRCATHVDALAHVSYDGLIFNGHPVSAVTQAGATVLGVEGMRAGIRGRGVLIDVARSRGVDHWAAGEAIGVADLEQAVARQGVELHEGDSLVLRTGWMRVFTRDGDRERYLRAEPGIALEVVEWLHERGSAFFACDNWGIDASPGERAGAFMPVQAVLTRDLGMPLGKLFDLEALAEHCAASGTWEFEFSCLPLPITGGVASPVAPVATF